MLKGLFSLLFFVLFIKNDTSKSWMQNVTKSVVSWWLVTHSFTLLNLTMKSIHGSYNSDIIIGMAVYTKAIEIYSKEIIETTNRWFVVVKILEINHEFR